MGTSPIRSQQFTEDGTNHFKRISDSVKHIDTISHSVSSGSNL